MSKLSHISEKELIQKCKEGNLKDLEKLYKHFYGYAMGIGLRYLNNRDDALEVVNDAFIKIFKAFSSFDSAQEFKPWLRRITINTALDRKRQDVKRMNHISLDEVYEMDYHEQPVSKLEINDIMKLLGKLPEIHKNVFNLYEIDGFNHNEIAEMLNIPASSSRTYLTRAKQQLRELLTFKTEHHG